MKNKGEKEGGPKEIERDGAREENLERKHHEEIKKQGRRHTYKLTYICVCTCVYDTPEFSVMFGNGNRRFPRGMNRSIC